MKRVQTTLLVLFMLSALLVPFASLKADADDGRKARSLGALTLPIAGTTIDAAGTDMRDSSSRYRRQPGRPPGLYRRAESDHARYLRGYRGPAWRARLPDRRASRHGGECRRSSQQLARCAHRPVGRIDRRYLN